MLWNWFKCVWYSWQSDFKDNLEYSKLFTNPPQCLFLIYNCIHTGRTLKITIKYVANVKVENNILESVLLVIWNKNKNSVYNMHLQVRSSLLSECKYSLKRLKYYN